MKPHDLCKNYQYTNNCVSLKHENNFHFLKLLMPIHLYENIEYQSTLKAKPKIHIKVSKCFKYTKEIEFSYLFKNANSEKIVIRSYEDAQVAEIFYCTNVQKFIRLLGPKINPNIHLKTRSQLNILLIKLLNFLLSSGYNHNHWQILPSKN